MAPLDTTIEIVTPEHIAFTYSLAGPFRRLNAYLIDLVLRAALLIVLAALLLPVFASFGGLGIALLGIGWFMFEWFYGGVCETYFSGQTPGKRWMALRVLTVDGQPINGLQAVLRNVLRAVDAMPWISLDVWGGPAWLGLPTWLLGLLAMLMSRRFQRLGDLVCGTIVVVEQRSWYAGVTQIEDQRALQLAQQLPADFTVSSSLARALVTYVDRRRYFSPPRRAELARPLAQVLIELLGLPPDTQHDLLLCALYYRTFVSESFIDNGQLEEEDARWGTR